VRAALVTPLSGPLEGFGRAGAEALRLWAAAAADLPGAHVRVELGVHDSGPGTAPALRAALEGRPDLLFGPYGTRDALAVARGTGRLVWNHGGASGRLSRHEHVVCVLSPASSYFEGALEMLRDEVRTVTVLHAETVFGREVAEGARRRAEALGLAVRKIGFEPGAAAAAVRRAPPAEVMMVAAGFEDERAAGRVLARRPWRACVLVGAGEEDVLAGLGEARDGWLGPAQWLADHPWEPDEGPDGDWFARRYEGLTGTVPPYPAAQAFAAGIIAARCAREAGGFDDRALRAAAASLECTTMYGPFRLDRSGAQAGHPVLTVRWEGGRRRLVWPPELVRAR
jgi:ABC-type branched-subunit amino acid transport system substrate-binding protein